MANGNAAAALGLEAVAASSRYTRAPAQLKRIGRSVARLGRIDRSHLGRICVGVVGPTRVGNRCHRGQWVIRIWVE
jgi:hypothetical protein